MTALRFRWSCEFAAFVLGGAVAGLFVRPFHSATSAILMVFAPLLAIFICKACFQGIRQLARLSKSLSWWHGLWLLLFVSALVFQVRDMGNMQEANVDASASLRVALVVLTAFVLLARLVLRQTRWTFSLLHGLVGIVTAYSLFCAASTLWSVYPAWTLYKSLEYLVDVIALAAIVATLRSTEGYQNLFDWTWALYGLLVASVWMGVVVWPDEALQQGVGVIGVQVNGVLPVIGANSVGEFGAVLAVVALARLLRTGESNRAWYGLLFAAGTVTMIFAQTRSAIGGFLLGVILVLSFSKRAALSLATASGVTLFLFHTTFSGLLWEFLKRGESEQELHTLTGRVDWWQFAWQKFLEHPLIGYGAYAAGRFFVIGAFREDPGSMHSEYAEVLVGTGLLGMLGVVLTLSATWFCLLRSFRSASLNLFDRQLAVEAIGVLGVITIRSFFSPNLFWHAPLMFFSILGYAEFLRRQAKCDGKIGLRLYSVKNESLWRLL